MEGTNRLAQAQEDKAALDAFHAEQQEKIEVLFKKKKKLLGELKDLKRPNEPIAFVLRTYGVVDMYENVKGDTFIIPPGAGTVNEKKFSWGSNDQTAKAQGRRVVYLTSRDLYEVAWGTETVKAYFINENDAACFNTDPKVWSERLEYTIDAILLNFENYRKQKDSGYDWVPKTVMWVAIGVVLYFVVRGLFPDMVPAIPGMGRTAQVVATNISNITTNVSGITILT